MELIQWICYRVNDKTVNSRKIVDVTALRLEGQRDKETIQSQGRSTWSEPNPWWGFSHCWTYPQKRVAGQWDTACPSTFPLPLLGLPICKRQQKLVNKEDCERSLQRPALRSCREKERQVINLKASKSKSSHVTKRKFILYHITEKSQFTNCYWERQRFYTICLIV